MSSFVNVLLSALETSSLALLIVSLTFLIESLVNSTSLIDIEIVLSLSCLSQTDFVPSPFLYFFSFITFLASTLAKYLIIQENYIIRL